MGVASWVSRQGDFYWVPGESVHVRVTGRGTFQNSQPLRLFALKKIDQGLEQFIIDLGTCQGRSRQNAAAGNVRTQPE